MTDQILAVKDRLHLSPLGTQMLAEANRARTFIGWPSGPVHVPSQVAL